MKKIAGFGGKTAAKKKSVRKHAAELPRDWGRYGITDAEIARYLRVNDDRAANVPLQIVRTLCDNVTVQLTLKETRNADSMDLARMQGMVIAYFEMARALTETLHAGRAMKAAGGFKTEGEPEE